MIRFDEKFKVKYNEEKTHVILSIAESEERVSCHIIPISEFEELLGKYKALKFGAN